MLLEIALFGHLELHVRLYCLTIESYAWSAPSHPPKAVKIACDFFF
jgi:hypothetical protein